MMRVLAPRFSQDPGDKWLTDSPLRRASFVYRDPALLWRTMLVLREFGAIEMPGAARALVERLRARGVEIRALAIADVPPVDGLTSLLAAAGVRDFE